MVGIDRHCANGHCERDSGPFILGCHFHYHHPTHGLVYSLFHQFDVHNELHNFVSDLAQSSHRSTQLTFRRMLIVLAFASMVTWLVRYRVLNMYARLPPESQRKEPQIDLFPDTQEGDSKPGLANYLDEFLSAIKIFGYREPICFRREGGFTDNSGSRTACLS